MELLDLQNTIDEINKKFGWDATSQPNPYEDTSSLAEEVGELFREVRKYEQQGKRKGHNETHTMEEVREELVGEIGDVLAGIITIANRYDIGLEEVIDQYKNKMNNRNI